MSDRQARLSEAGLVMRKVAPPSPEELGRVGQMRLLEAAVKDEDEVFVPS